MQNDRSLLYAEGLARLIRIPTVSVRNQQDRSSFYQFHQALRDLFPDLFRVCEFEDFNGSFLLRWKGSRSLQPICLMNHHDVVEAPGSWKYPPFSGTIAEGKVWGRGTLDNKGGLYCMLQAAQELAKEGYVPERDIYFLSACTEESDSTGADTISAQLLQRGIRFAYVLDEGGMILEEPLDGAKGTFAMVGLGEKGCADLKFIARSQGGHASTPGKDTPLVRLGKFMAEAEKGKIFPSALPEVICRMFRTIALTMPQPMRFVLRHPKLFRPVLIRVIPMISDTAGAMLRTTLAFTMAQGSEGTNVLPQEAWVMGNMRFSHHQGSHASIAAAAKLAKKYDIEVEVIDPGMDSSISNADSDAFKLIREAVDHLFPGVYTCPYLMTGASDCRFMSRVSDQCLRFAPLQISHSQLSSFHAVNENVDIKALVPAVDFYKYLICK